MDRPGWLKVGARVRQGEYTGTVLAVVEDPNGVTYVMWWAHLDGRDPERNSFTTIDLATELEPIREMVTGEVAGTVEVGEDGLGRGPDLPRGTYHIIVKKETT